MFRHQASQFTDSERRKHRHVHDGGVRLRDRFQQKIKLLDPQKRFGTSRPSPLQTDLFRRIVKEPAVFDGGSQHS